MFIATALSAKFHASSTWLGQVVLGRDPLQRDNVGRVLRSAGMFGFACVILMLATVAGLAPSGPTVLEIAYTLSGLGLLYVLVRSGRSAQFSDPSLAYPVLLFGLSAIVLAYATIPVAKGAALQLLCLLLAFEMDRLSSGRLFKASLMAVALLTLSSVVHLTAHPGAQKVSSELWNLLMSAVMVPTAIVVGAEVGRLHRRLAEQREALARTLSQLRKLSSHDSLTGLCNRRQMMALLAQEIKRRKRVGQPFCVAILDIDWFKRVNDTHGHNVGDEVLQHFARLCSAQLHGADTLARWGGEEFCLLMPACEVERVMDVLANLRQAVASYDWTAHAPGLHLSFSAGVAQHEEAEPLTATLERADKALYAAKHRGRDAAVAYSADMHAPEAGAALGGAPCVAKDQTESSIESHEGEATVTVLGEPLWHEAPAVVNTPQPPAGHSWWQGLLGLLVGADPQMRDRLRLSLMAMATYAFWIVMINWYAIPSGLMDTTIGNWMVRYCVVGMLMFYPLIRSGWSARFQDAELMMTQMLVGTGAGLICYAGAPDLRPSVLHLMCVIQIFGMVNLRPRACMVAGLGTVGMMVGLLVLMVAQKAPHFVPLGETLRIVLASFIVWRLAVLSRQYARVRMHVAAEFQKLEAAVAQVQELVIRDELTGLFNRKHMQDLLAKESERFERTGYRFCVALIDLDHFKHVNDTFGHHVGDEVLIGFGRAATTILRETDVIGRWGGEEFLVLTRDTDPSVRGLYALSRLREQMHGLRLAPAYPDLQVTFSCGVTLAKPGEPLRTMLERADRALYAAKAAGRDRCILADDLGGQGAPLTSAASAFGPPAHLTGAGLCTP